MVQHDCQELQSAFQVALSHIHRGEITQGSQHFSRLSTLPADAQALAEGLLSLRHIAFCQGNGAEIIVADLLKTSTTPRTIRTALGGTVKETNTEAVLHAEIEGHSVSTYALVISNIGNDEDGNPIEILFGALAMQQWGIKLDLSKEKLDLSNYPEEFVEF